jgi:hypothetical protein
MSATTSSPVAERRREETIGAAGQILRAAQDDGAEARVLGGVAVALRCPSARGDAPLARSYSDIDLVTGKRSARALAGTLERLGYAPHERFNAVHGHSRMMFARGDGVHVDVFVEQFVMCHRLDVGSRLGVHEETLPLADLVLTKLQVAELNEKDVTDAAALLLDHELTADERGVNVEYVTGILSRDWGWWRTVSHNLRLLPDHLRGRLPEPAAAQVAARVERLLAAIDAAPKSLKWKARAKVGERVPWREDPEESH